MHLRSLALILALPVLTLTACGGDDGGGGASSEDKDAITKVLQDGLTSKDPKTLCGGSLSTAFMDKVYGGEDKCQTVEQGNLKDDDQADSVDVSDISVDGKKATATVAIKGGSNDGSKGPLDLAKQGEDWRVDDLSPELLRSQFEAAIAGDQELPKDTLDCVKDKIGDLDDAELKDVAYGAIGEREDQQSKLVQLVTTCSPDLVRNEVEKSVTDALEQQGASQKTIDCVKRELRERISDDELNQATGGDTSVVREKGTEAAKACGVQGG